MRFTLVTAALLAAGAAEAAEPKRFGVHLMTGLLVNDVDTDKVKQEGRPKTGGDSEDLERDFGIQGTFEVPVAPRLHVGGRLAFFTAEGDDSDAAYRTYDAGGWGRYIFGEGQLQPFAGAGLGLTYATGDADENGIETEISGLGWHLMLGGGLTYSVSSAVDLFGGFFFLRQHIFEADGELSNDTGSVDFTAEDVVFSRFLLVVGAMF